MRVYQFRHIRAEGQCSGDPNAATRRIFGLNRGLLLLALAALALPLATGSARAPEARAIGLVELVVTLKQPQAGRGSRAAVRRLERYQDRFVALLERAVPEASVRWRYRLVLDGLAVVAPARAATRIAALPEVAAVYPSVRYRRSLFRSPAVIGAPQLWGPTLATAGNRIKIGIIDDGIDQMHPFFSAAGFTMPPGFPKGKRAYTTAKVIVARAFPPPTLRSRAARLPFDPKTSVHGTHVAGIAAGDYGTTAPGPSGGKVKVSGIAPRAYLGNYRVLTIPTGQFGDDGNSPEIVEGIEAAVRDGMNVINLSIGEPEIAPSRDIVVQAIDGAAAAGVVPVIAAGNDFRALGSGTIDSPGSAPLAITAAAATKSRAIADFSSAGPTPYSLQLKPDVSAPGVSIYSSVPAGYGYWTELDGTSMAAPHVAGAVALLLQRHPGWTVAQVKSALMLTGNPVAGGRGEASPTREGGGMIWLPRADRPLVFASPPSVSFGLLHRGRVRVLPVRLSDAGGGAGSWSVSVVRRMAGRGVRVAAPSHVSVPGTLSVRATVSGGAAAADTSGFVVLTRAGRVRRIPFWLHVTAAALARDPHRLLRRPGLYRGDTRGGAARVAAYRFPTSPDLLGIRARLRGPEQVFRFVLRRPVANAGAVVVSEDRGVHVSPRLLRAGDENRLAGYTALPLRLNPYKPSFFGFVPAVGVFRPTPGAYDLVFDTPSRAAAGRFTFRFWVNDSTPPRVRLLTGNVRAGAPLRVGVRDHGSGVDPQSLSAFVDGRSARLVWFPSGHRASVFFGTLARRRHRLVFSASDYQETKNNENAGGLLLNTRRLATTFVVR